MAYSLSFASWFLLFLFFQYLNAVYQASMNPGLEKLNNPSFWFSAVGNAYLFVTDRERWMLYASLLAYLSGVILLTPLVYIVVERALALNMLSLLEVFTNWFEGVLLVFLCVMTVLSFAAKGATKATLKKPVQKRLKKVCPKCGREVWLDFGPCPNCGELLLD